MGSIPAMREGSADRYFQDSGEERSKMVPEGIEGMVPFKGSVHQMLTQVVGGVRSGMGLAGCASVESLRTECRLVRVTAAGLKESHAHDVVITKEAPNYWLNR
jgi:IMP dehydrogenase